MEISLKLLPVSPVSRRVPVDARYAFRDTAPAELRLTLAGREVMRRKPGEPNAAGWSSGVRKLHLNRLSGRAEVKFELLDERGGVIADAVQVLEIVDAESRSTGRIDGAWCGLYHWSEEEGRLWNAELKRFTAADWRELVRSMHGIGMDVIVLQELFRNQEYYGRHRISETAEGRSIRRSCFRAGWRSAAAIRSKRSSPPPMNWECRYFRGSECTLGLISHRSRSTGTAGRRARCGSGTDITVPSTAGTSPRRCSAT